MWLILIRTVVVGLLAHAGYLYGPFNSPWAGALLGALIAAGVIFLEIRVRAVPGHHMVGALVGGVTGLVGARLLWGALTGLDVIDEHFVHVLLVVFLTYMGVVIGGQKGEWFEPARIIAAFQDSSRLHQYKVLDTSVIIDGRIADICETGFLEGTLVVPQFVLRELQQVADSSDSMKRNRGRRGLDILQKVQKMAGVHVQIVETDFPEIREVDLKLIELARRMNGKIVTNDFNLNKVAQLRGVPVLNINELANSLKPVVLPGEVMRVFILKEGKEAGQGVAYLDDGTMVVVDQAKRALGRTIEVTVTSVLQTTAGKMIFCRWSEAGVSEDTGRYRVGERRDDRRDGRNGRDYRGAERRDGEKRDDRWADRPTAPMTPVGPITAAVPAAAAAVASGSLAAVPAPTPVSGPMPIPPGAVPGPHPIATALDVRPNDVTRPVEAARDPALHDGAGDRPAAKAD
jgi:uncharacterized protein YacL